MSTPGAGSPGPSRDLRGAKHRPRRIRMIAHYLVHDGGPSRKGRGLDVVDTPQAAMPFLSQFADRDREHLIAIFLNARNQLIGLDVVSVGTMTASLVHPREVFKGAILMNAAALILAHNHPSGDHLPSPEDRESTRRMANAGELLGIKLHDHIILSPGGGFYSFKTEGRL